MKKKFENKKNRIDQKKFKLTFKFIIILLF